ncbi:UNVERIFIED_CONTAM: VIN3-like protein 2 [Sesamum radiatum]|uniref:VIN3-like protein 2 n=1 Tax=Sesamum radiatum TaxID=300843 RepID=A0AAW2NAQ3_SESRA
MDASSLEAMLFDPSKCSKLSMEAKRELVYEVSKWSDGAMEMLHAWSRQDILQILCAELGKERKYTGLTKSKIIEQLLKIVYEKKSQERGFASISEVQPTSENGERTPKRQRKSDHPNRLPIAANPAATVCLSLIQDPGLWLICNSDPPFHGVSCGMSCHLECALRHENSGISKDRQDKGLDGSFCCVSCGKVNDLLGSWRKQLVVARDTRRVDILCYRLSLGQKILGGTKHYQKLCGMIDEAVEKLEDEVGPLTGLPVKKARGIVNRLSSGPEIQRLCASAVESLDLMLSKRVSDMPSDCSALVSKLVRFEDIHASSITVILNNDDSNGEVSWVMCYGIEKLMNIYPTEPTCRLFAPNTKLLLSGLTPATEYFLKVVTLTKTERRASVNFSSELQVLRMSSEAGQQITPCKLESLKNGAGWKNKRKNGKGIDAVPEREEEPQAGSSSKKRSGERRDEDCTEILTWYSLRATPQEVRIVKVFIDTFIEDPESLAAQLVDSFTDIISNKRCSTVPSDFA